MRQVTCSLCQQLHSETFCPLCGGAHPDVPPLPPTPTTGDLDMDTQQQLMQKIAVLEDQVQKLTEAQKSAGHFFLQKAMEGYDARLQLLEQNKLDVREFEGFNHTMERSITPVVEQVALEFKALSSLLIQIGVYTEDQYQSALGEMMATMQAKYEQFMQSQQQMPSNGAPAGPGFGPGPGDFGLDSFPTTTSVSLDPDAGGQQGSSS